MIKKRTGKVVPYDFSKIESAVLRTFLASGYDRIPPEFYEELKNEPFRTCKTVEDVQDRIERLLYYSGLRKVYNNFVTYRAEHALARENREKALFDSIASVEKNDTTRDNGNMNADSPAGQMMKFASESTKPYVDKYLLSDDVLKAVKNNTLYIHDKDYYPTKSLTCITGDAYIRLRDHNGNVINTNLAYLDRYFKETECNGVQVTKPSKFLRIEGRNGWTKIKSISRHRVNPEETLLEIKLSKGRSLKVTGDHLIPVMVDDVEVLKYAKHIQPNDLIAKVVAFDQNIADGEYIDMIKAIKASNFSDAQQVKIINCDGLRYYLKYRYGEQLRTSDDHSISLDEYARITRLYEIPYEFIQELTVVHEKEHIPIFLPISNELVRVVGFMHAYREDSYLSDFKSDWNDVFPIEFTMSQLYNDNTLIPFVFRNYIMNYVAESIGFEQGFHYVSSFLRLSELKSKKIILNASKKDLPKVHAVINNFLRGMYHNESEDLLVIEDATLVEKLYAKFIGLKLDFYNIFKADKPKDALIEHWTPVLDVVRLMENPIVYDLETVEHWWVANGIVVHNCLQHPLDTILNKGFIAGHGEVRPAKRIETASVVAAISMETIQNEMHGGQSIPAFDFYMAPYVRST
ncbi:MAG: hypothetical protein IKU29_01895, partial [Parabacteroides sp.]|nr:hypothetical protein [Parabacteroides sp.]